MPMMPIEAGLWDRMLLAMRVATRQLRAADAARLMGVSRRTFYQLATRGWQGMAAAMTPRPAGRPGAIRDPERDELRAQNARLQQENGPSCEKKSASKDLRPSRPLRAHAPIWVGHIACSARRRGSPTAA